MSVTWRGKMKYDQATHLWVRDQSDAIAHDVKGSRFRKGFLRRTIKKTLYSPSGRPICEVQVNGVTGNSHHVRDEGIDAVARPDTLVLSAQMKARRADLAKKVFNEKEFGHLPEPLRTLTVDYESSRLASMQDPDSAQKKKAYTAAKRKLAVYQGQRKES